MGARTPRVRIPPLAPLNPGRAVTRGGVHPSPRRAWWTSRSRHPGFHDSRAVGRTRKPDPRVRCSSQALRAHEPDGRVRSPCLLPQVPAAVATSPRSCPPTAALPPHSGRTARGGGSWGGGRAPPPSTRTRVLPTRLASLGSWVPPARGGARWGWLKRVLFSREIHWREGGSGRVLGLRLGCVVGASSRSLGYRVLGGQGRSRGIMLGGRAATLPS